MAKNNIRTSASIASRASTSLKRTGSPIAASALVNRKRNTK